MQKINLYSYSPHKIINIYTGTEMNYNTQFGNTIISAYQGAQNPLQFTLMNADNKPMSYSLNSTYEFVVYDVSNKIVIRKLLTIDSTIASTNTTLPSVNSNNFVRSTFSTVLDSSDTAMLECSNSYKWTINSYDSTTQQTAYFYTSLNETTSGEFHVLPYYSNFLSPSIECTNWNKYTEYKYMNYDIVGSEINSLTMNWNMFMSDVVPGNTVQSKDSTEGTIVLYLTNFTGAVCIQGTLDAVPPDDQSFSRWFNIPDNSGNTIFSYTNSSLVDAINISGKFSFIRILKYQQMSTYARTIDTGSLNRALVRF